MMSGHMTHECAEGLALAQAAAHIAAVKDDFYCQQRIFPVRLGKEAVYPRFVRFPKRADRPKQIQQGAAGAVQGNRIVFGACPPGVFSGRIREIHVVLLS